MGVTIWYQGYNDNTAHRRHIPDGETFGMLETVRKKRKNGDLFEEAETSNEVGIYDANGNMVAITTNWATITKGVAPCDMDMLMYCPKEEKAYCGVHEAHPCADSDGDRTCREHLPFSENITALLRKAEKFENDFEEAKRIIIGLGSTVSKDEFQAFAERLKAA